MSTEEVINNSNLYQLSKSQEDQLRRLGLTPYNKNYAENLFSLPQNEEEWKKERMIRCTASEMGLLAGYSTVGDTETAISLKFNPPLETEAMKRGLRDEPLIAHSYHIELQVN